MKIKKLKKRIKCPKCKNTDINLIEISNGFSITYSGEDGEYFEAGELEAGDPHSVRGECKKCEYNWRLKKVRTVESLFTIN